MVNQIFKNKRFTMPPKKKSGITAEFLADKYERQGLSVAEIAKDVGCSKDLVYHYLKKYSIKKRSKVIDLTGKRFHAFVVVSLLRIENSRALWLCKCDCGKTFESTSSEIKKRKSCGCRIIDGTITHGMTNSRPYRIWRGMKTRCDNPNAINYDLYGGRGISYDPRWSRFDLFWDDMKDGYNKKLTLDRADANGNYCKQNCRWATTKEQSLNKNSSHKILCDGESKTVTEWAELFGINRGTLFSRVKTARDESSVIKNLKLEMEN